MLLRKARLLIFSDTNKIIEEVYYEEILKIGSLAVVPYKEILETESLARVKVNIKYAKKLKVREEEENRCSSIIDRRLYKRKSKAKLDISSLTLYYKAYKKQYKVRIDIAAL